jgi:hypothetical protein
MTDGEIMYLALCSFGALAFIISLGYATSVASGGPRSSDDEKHPAE